MSWGKGVHPILLPYFQWLVQQAQRLDSSARVTSAYRTRAEQTRLYRRYLAGLSRFPAAPPGRSKHEQGRAIDLIARDEVLRRLGAAWQQMGGRWGGERDPIHFEA